MSGRRLFPYLAVGPVALLVALGVVYPIGYVVVLSAHDYSPFQMRAMQFVGAGNYGRLVGDPEFWASLRAGAIWVAGSVIPQFLLGLAMMRRFAEGRWKAMRVIESAHVPELEAAEPA